MADPAVSPRTAFDQADTARAAAIEAEQADVAKRYDVFETGEQQRLSRQGEELRTMRGAVDRAMQEEQQLGQQRPKPAVLPEPPRGPVVNAKDYEGLSYALIGLALIGGVASKGDWLGVSATLNGALKGFHEGSKEAAEKQYQDFVTQYNAAMQKQEQADKEYERILTDRRQTINEMLTKLQLAGVQYGHDDVAAAARLRSIDRAQQQVEAHRQSRFAAQERFDIVDAQIQGSLKRAAVTSGSGLKLSDDAEQVYDLLNRQTGGKSDIIKPLNSRYGRASAVPHFESMIADMKADGLSNEDIANELAQAGPRYAGKAAAYRQTAAREAGVARLTESIQSLESTVMDLAKKVVPTGVPPLNARVNDFRAAMGDPGIVQLRNLLTAIARQYIEAVTMPGSNAQLHASSQETADAMINANMSIAQIKSSFQAMNQEIGATSGALSTISDRLLKGISDQGLTLRPRGDFGATWQEYGGSAANGAPQGDWLKRAMDANPGMSREQVVEQGKRLGKLPADAR